MAFMRGRIRAPKNESRKVFNPATANGVRTSNIYVGKSTSRLCLHCREWFKTKLGGGDSDDCQKEECRKKESLLNGSGCIRPVDPDKAVSGWYEHISGKPIYIESRKQLYRACIQHGVQAKALMSGGVMKRPRGA